MEFIRPPRPTPWGNSAGRGALKPIGDDDWSEDIDPEEGVTRSSALKTPILGIENCSIKNEKMPKSSESMPEYSSSSDSELLESSTQASGEYSDYSRFTPTGYSGDDNRSLTSSEFSFKGTLDREMVDPPFTKNLQKSCLYQQKQGDDSTEGGEEKKKQRVRKILRTLLFLSSDELIQSNTNLNFPFKKGKAPT